VPSGNFGNVYAGHVARSMGRRSERSSSATNENDVLDEFFRTGRYRVRKAAEVHATSSPSMDISKSSNFERYAFDLVGGDAKTLRTCGEARGRRLDRSVGHGVFQAGRGDRISSPVRAPRPTASRPCAKCGRITAS